MEKPNKEDIKYKIRTGNNLGISYKINWQLFAKDLEEWTDKQLLLYGVGSSLPSKNDELIENMCLSFRHDFGLLPNIIKEDLRKDCKNWLIAYENNTK